MAEYDMSPSRHCEVFFLFIGHVVYSFSGNTSGTPRAAFLFFDGGHDGIEDAWDNAQDKNVVKSDDVFDNKKLRTAFRSVKYFILGFVITSAIDK